MPAERDPLPTATRPVPARVIVQVDASDTGARVPGGTLVTADGAPAEFRTAADAVVPPVTLSRADRHGGHVRLTLASRLPWSAVRLRLPDRVDTAAASWGLRLFVGTAAAYRALTAEPVTVGVNGRRIADALRPAGFDVADAVLPTDPREPEAVRLLAEWAVCPEKFLFVDVLGLSPDVYANVTGPLHVDLHLGLRFHADLTGARVGCVPAINRRATELPPVPLRGEATVRLNADPLADPTDRPAVVEVLRVRSVRGGRTLTTYAERLAPLPPPLAARPSAAGAWSLSRRDGHALLTLTEPVPPVPGRTLLVTAACCQPSLPAGPIAWAAGVRPVTAVRPPVWPAGGDLALDVVRRPADLVDAVRRHLGGDAVVERCDVSPAELPLAARLARGVDVRLSIAGPPDAAFLLARVLDVAMGTAAPVDGFTRLTVDGVWAGPPRSGKDAVAVGHTPGAGARLDDSSPGRSPPSGRTPNRSVRQAATLAAHFAAVGWPLSATALAGVLRHVLAVPVRVEPLATVRVPAGDPVRLGTAGRTLGRRRPAWGVRVVLGPLDRRAFDRFDPDTRATRRLGELLMAALGEAVPAVVHRVLRVDDVVPWRLGEGRLGRSLWVGPVAVG